MKVVKSGVFCLLRVFLAGLCALPLVLGCSTQSEAVGGGGKKPASPVKPAAGDSEEPVASISVFADKTADAYSLFAEAGFGYETPEQENGGHAGTPHITQKYDETLKKDVFVFTLHLNADVVDGSSTGEHSRQRVEVKIDDAEAQAQEGREFVYRWKFRLPSDFAASDVFTHIHQLKNEGGDASAALITLSVRENTSKKVMQLIYRAPTYVGEGGGSTSSPNRYLAEVPLSGFLGEWVSCEERVVYSAGEPEYGIKVTRLRDGEELIAWEYTGEGYAAVESEVSKWPFATWREGNAYGRPKYGIYRRVWLDEACTQLAAAGLKDESVLFADFEVERLK